MYALQQVDTNLDELQEMKGDLPHIVADLESKLREKENSKQQLDETVKNSIVTRDATDTEILSLREKIEKYKSQQFQVKTNKQYDALAREIDGAQDRITKLTKEMDVLEGRAATARTDGEKVSPELEELKNELAERRKELDEVNKEHEDEELKLQHEREKIVGRISKPDLHMYEKIRKAKDGKAVVPVKRNACGGCFNRVPPQRVLELRKNSTLLTCERCGRILVSDEIVGSAASAL